MTPPNATIVSREDLAPDLAIFRMASDEGAAPVFEAGQYVTLGLAIAEPPVQGAGGAPALTSRFVRRAFSIASSPATRDHLEFLVAHVDGGEFTTPLWALGVGGRIWIDPHVRGRFTLAGVPADAHVLLIATGTGIAPYMSMLRAYASQARWSRVAVVHGARLVRDLAYRQEIEDRVQRDRAVAYVATVTREPASSAWPGARGRIPALLRDTPALARQIGFPLDPSRVHVFACGNPDMLQEVQALLESRGFHPQAHGVGGNLHFERYW